MKRIFLAGILALAGVAGMAVLGATAPAQAQAEAPWCAQQDLGLTHYSDCTYWSLQDCVREVVAGNRGFCTQNPAYRGPAPERRIYHHRRYPR